MAGRKRGLAARGYDWVGRDVFLPFPLVPIMRWTKEQHEFDIEAYFFSIGRLTVTTQRVFRAHLHISTLAGVPSCQKIVTQVRTFRVNGNVEKRSGAAQNIEVVRQSFLQFH